MQLNDPSLVIAPAFTAVHCVWLLCGNAEQNYQIIRDKESKNPWLTNRFWVSVTKWNKLVTRIQRQIRISYFNRRTSSDLGLIEDKCILECIFLWCQTCLITHFLISWLSIWWLISQPISFKEVSLINNTVTLTTINADLLSSRRLHLAARWFYWNELKLQVTWKHKKP